MLHRLIRTPDDPILVLLRLTLAVVIFPHGAQKALGWFGGHGFSATVSYFSDTLGIPPLLAVLVIAAEFLGPIALALGLFTRAAAFGVAPVMTGAVFFHLDHGFFMNWSGNQAGEGFEYHLLAIALALAVLAKGAGPVSVDRRLAT